MAGSKPGGSQSKHLKPRVGNGAGWGGPAKGFVPNPRTDLEPFQAGNPGDPSRWPMTNRRKIREEQHEEQMDRLHEIAMGEIEAQTVQVQAIVAFGNRVHGTPRQTVDTNLSGKLTLKELVEQSFAGKTIEHEDE